MDKHVTIKLFNELTPILSKFRPPCKGSELRVKLTKSIFIFLLVSASGRCIWTKSGIFFLQETFVILSSCFQLKSFNRNPKIRLGLKLWETEREEAFKDLKLGCQVCQPSGGGWGAALYFGQTVFRIYIFIVCLSKTGYTSLCQQRFSLEKIFYKM